MKAESADDAFRSALNGRPASNTPHSSELDMSSTPEQEETCMAHHTRALGRKVLAAGKQIDAEHIRAKATKLEQRMLAAFPLTHPAHQAFAAPVPERGAASDPFALVEAAGLTEVPCYLRACRIGER